MKRLSLRARLLLGMVGLVFAAVSIFGLATVMLLRAYLTDRVDTQLIDARAGFNRVASSFDGRLPPDAERSDRGPGARRFGASTFVVQFFDAQGVAVSSLPSGLTDRPDPLPDLPAFTYQSAGAYESPFTVGAQGDESFHYRVLVTRLQSTQHIAVMAIPLNGDNATIQRALIVELIVALAVLVLVAIVGLRVVRVGLRPLNDMTDTATAIAGGDLSHRVNLPADRADEVGRLGVALNGMLTQIEAGFQEKDVSEQHLRQFVADASHELRTPLTSIRGYAELYRRGALQTDEAVADAVRRIEDESARMSVLVDDLLLLARLDQGSALEHDDVDLVDVVGDAVRDSLAVDPHRPISFSHDDEVSVTGDRTRLHQVAANLLDNARVHTPERTPIVVTVMIEADMAVLRVCDSGPGLEPEVATRVFERSFRGDASPRNHPGTGLGLSIVAAIAEAHGGRATVESTVGEGSAFSVALPRSP